MDLLQTAKKIFLVYSRCWSGFFLFLDSNNHYLYPSAFCHLKQFKQQLSRIEIYDLYLDVIIIIVSSSFMLLYHFPNRFPSLLHYSRNSLLIEGYRVPLHNYKNLDRVEQWHGLNLRSYCVKYSYDQTKLRNYYYLLLAVSDF